MTLANLMCGCFLTPTVNMTGSICVQPSIVTEYKTNDFIKVTSDLTNRIASEFDKEMKKTITSESKMQVVDCGASDYELITSFNTIKIEGQGSLSLIPNIVGRSNQKTNYALTVDYRLKSKEVPLILSGDVHNDRDDISDLLTSLSREIVDNIKNFKVTK